MGKFSAGSIGVGADASPVGRLSDPRQAVEPQMLPGADAPRADAVALAPELARGVLIAGLVGGAALGLSLTVALAGPLAVEAELARLLRFMVGVKALILLGAAALVLMRLRGPVTRRALLGYAGSLSLSAGALGWLWGLSSLALGSLLFYGGMVLAFRVASADPLLMQGLRPGR